MKKITFILLLLSFHSIAQLNGFTLTGNPQSPNGATWTYQDRVDGIWYDLEGILFVPASGTPPYPAVIINHGTGGNAYGYSRNMAMKMVQWNFVCIATNLCHSAGVPIGSPGDTSFANQGASVNNSLRGMKCRDILCSLAEVDTNCIMAFGHSRGAYATTGLVAMNPGKFSCAGHTAGGAIQQSGYSAPSTTLAAQVTCPYIMHHGDSDHVVPAFYDSTLNAVFDGTGITHHLYIYPGLDHPQMSLDSLMLVRTHDWFMNHSCMVTLARDIEYDEDLQIIPQSGIIFKIISGDPDFNACLYNINGQKILETKSDVIDCNECSPGIYLLKINTRRKYIVKKIAVSF